MKIEDLKNKHVIVTGGAGFIGSHLCERLLELGAFVTCIDNFITSKRENVQPYLGGVYHFVERNVTEGYHTTDPVFAILHFASPASPADYLKYPIETLKVGALGTHKMLGLAKAKKARFLLASTSEVYGDPEIHPQKESYWGNVNPVGPRGVYDEAKRFAEAISMAYHRTHGVKVRIARIFNTYGPHMRANDGRAIPNFISQALSNKPLTIAGSGKQTRSFCFIDDQVEGLLRLLMSDCVGPVNIGNPKEMSVEKLAKLIIAMTGSKSKIKKISLPVDDPKVRQPDISLAKKVLKWKPEISIKDGLHRTISWFRYGN